MLKEECYQKSSARYFPGSFAEKKDGGFIDDDLADEVALGPTLNILATNQYYIPQDKKMSSLRHNSQYKKKQPGQQNDCFI